MSDAEIRRLERRAHASGLWEAYVAWKTSELRGWVPEEIELIGNDIFRGLCRSLFLFREEELSDGGLGDHAYNETIRYFDRIYSAEENVGPFRSAELGAVIVVANTVVIQIERMNRSSLPILCEAYLAMPENEDMIPLGFGGLLGLLCTGRISSGVGELELPHVDYYTSERAFRYIQSNQSNSGYILCHEGFVVS
jgi:hypothetical protein